MATGQGSPSTNADQVFSDDENEKKFMKDLCWIEEDHWIQSEMKWNTIHGIEWLRCSELGAGSWGAVAVGTRHDGMIFAVKSIPVQYPLTNRSKRRMQVQISEIKMMRYLRSKYIVRCLGCGRSSAANGLCNMENKIETLDVFMEFSVRGSLRNLYEQRSAPFEENPFIKQYTYDILKALQYMRKKRVVHGDIKMANLLMDNDCVKLADWGGAKRLDKTNLRKRLIGTMGFRSPEVVFHYQQGYPADIFSLGCTVIEMATGSKPEEILTTVMGLNQFMKYESAVVSEIRIPQLLSAECRDFLKHCLCRKLEDRWTAAELLHHPFITNRDKTNNLPYSIIVDPAITRKLLRPPRRLDPEPPDERPTRRVRTCLASCGANLPPVPLADPPDLVPNFRPDFYVGRWGNSFNRQQQMFPDIYPKIPPTYESPDSTHHILVPTPTTSPEHPQVFIDLSSASSPKRQQKGAIDLNNSSSSSEDRASRERTPVASPQLQMEVINQNSSSKSSNPTDVVSPPFKEVLNFVSSHSSEKYILDSIDPVTRAFEAQDFLDAMVKSTSFMARVNNDIYEETIEAAAQFPAAIGPQGLFPRIVRSELATPSSTTLEELLKSFLIPEAFEGMCRSDDSVQPKKRKGAPETSNGEQRGKIQAR